MKNSRQMFLSLLVMLTLLFSSFGAIHVYADDTSPTPEATEEAIVEEGSADPSPEAQATEEAAADPTEEAGATEPAATEAAGEEGDEATPEATEEASDPTDEPAAEETAEPTEEAGPTEEADPTEEPTAEPTPMLPDEDLDTLPEILENVPEGTEIVVLDADGNVAPMASEEAAETMLKGDPIWCQDGYAPDPSDTTHCTGSHTSFSSLIAELSTNAGGYFTGPGTIWVAWDYDVTQDNHQIRFDADPTYDALTNPHPLDNLGDLTLQGGWNGTSGDATITGTSTIDVSMVFLNWTTNLTFNDLIFTNTEDTTNFSINANTPGTVTMDHVSASNATNGNVGAMITGNSGVTITNSSFNNNDDFGLMAWSSGGDIRLTNVTADGNAFTGAYLDTCNGSQVTGLCDGTGSVTVDGTSSSFSDNDYDGLHIVSGGSTTLANVTADLNDQRGLNFYSWSDGGTGFIDIDASVFTNNGGTGMYISQYADGDITIDDTTVAINRIGAQIYSTRGSGAVRITNSTFAESTYTGLHVESTGNIFLTGSTAGSLGVTYAGNMNNGAYLISSGNITVASSTFNDNVQTSSPADPGLYAKAGGNIDISNIYANNNLFGSGAVLQTTGTGDIDVDTLSQFNNNGIFGLQANITNGTLTLNEVTANLNAVKGAYLNANGLSDIEISNSTFTENGSYGAYTSTAEGNIFVVASVFDGNTVTSIGAKLISSQGGDIEVVSSTFSENEIGLYTVGEANVTLTDITSTDNTSHDVKLFSTFTQKGCYCPGDENTSITATVNNGNFTNSPVGIYAKPGDAGSVTFTGTQDYAGTTDPYILDTDPIPACTDCGGCGTSKDDEKDGKTYNVIEVPFSGSGNVSQECDIYSGTILQLPDGTAVKVRCPFDGFSNLQGLNFADLPGLLDEDTFELGILLGLLGEDGSFVLNSDGSITLTFVIPESNMGHDQRLMFWDTDAKDGEGAWVEMPPFEHGTSFMLHPDDPEDPRMIVSGVVKNGNTLSITVNFAGYFVVMGN